MPITLVAGNNRRDVALTPLGPPAAIDLQVMAGADDATENAAGNFIIADLLLVRSYPGATPYQRSSTGLRFQNVAIHRGAVILASYLSLYPTDPLMNSANMKIYLEAIGSALDFVANPHIISPAFRPRTISYTPWVQDGLATSVYITSPSLNAPLQELVNRVDWAPGNSLVFLMIANEDIAKALRFLNKENYLNLPAKLHIEYV